MPWATCARADSPAAKVSASAGGATVSPQWKQQLENAFKEFVALIADRRSQLVRFERLEQELAGMKAELDTLKRAVLDPASCKACVVPIATLSPYRLRLVKPIDIVIERAASNSFVASFLDANINGSGETVLDAFEDVRDAIVSAFLAFVRHEDRLGPEPRRQLAVLREFLEEMT